MKKLKSLFRRYPDSIVAEALRKYVTKGSDLRRPAAATHRTKVAVQCVPNDMYFGLMAALAADLKKHHDVDIELVVVRSISGAMGFSPWSELRRSAAVNWLFVSPWVRSFGALAERVAYWSTSWNYPVSDFLAIGKSYRIWKQWRRKPRTPTVDWSNEVVAGLVCGDLVVDSYLRFRPVPRFNVDDPFVWRIIWQVIRDANRASQYFGRNRPAAYLTSYSVYVDHGVSVRAALQKGVPVYAFGSLSHFVTRLSDDQVLHTPDCRSYKHDFASLSPPVQRDCLLLAEERLSFRLRGGVDGQTAYMRNSAYSASVPNSISDDAAGSVVVFLHDFFDSAHVWRELVFSDFWDWACLTIETLHASSIPFYLKPHPNQIALSETAVAALKAKYPFACWLPSSTSNAALARAPIVCGVTVYGTIAHELAFMGVPSIGAAAHPHEAFEFCRRARSRAEYVALLQDISSRPLSIPEMKTQALQFYSIYNNLHDKFAASAAQTFTSYFIVTSADGDTDTKAQNAVATLDALRREHRYQSLIKELVPPVLSSSSDQMAVQ